MAELVEVFVIRAEYFAVAFGWNNNLHTHRLSELNQRVHVVTSVSQKGKGIDSHNQLFSKFAIRSGTCCNKYSDRHTMRIHGQMYLGVKPPFVFPISWFPPTAPAA